jgi:hypothetical protein
LWQIWRLLSFAHIFWSPTRKCFFIFLIISLFFVSKNSLNFFDGILKSLNWDDVHCQ